MSEQLERILVVPQPDDQVALLVDGQLRCCWHFATRYPRPFLYPLVDPHGEPLTRMGHPAAPDHDHHRSVWFGHRSVGGVDFWSERSGGQHIRQTTWIHYQDGDDAALMAVRLGWFDAHGVKLLSQDLVLSLTELDDGEYLVELQSEFRAEPTELVLGKTNFGFLGIRVARGVSARYGYGELQDSEGRRGEGEVFGRAARWVDYSGITAANRLAGISYFDHPSNPRHPTLWHVRDDGWMCASFCMQAPLVLHRGRALRLRYGLFVHRGRTPRQRIEAVWQDFARWGPWQNIGSRNGYRVWFQRQVPER